MATGQLNSGQLNSGPSDQADFAAAPWPAGPTGRVPFRTALAHTWYLTGRKLHALVRQP